VAYSHTFGHIEFMGKLFALGLGVLMLGFVVGDRAAAREPPIETASVVVRAWGKYGVVHAVRSVERATTERGLPREVNAGAISRTLLRAQLALGIGRFLQQVRAEAALSNGHWTGWRLRSLFANRADVQVRVLRVGDIVSHINGQSIERPEDFKAVWDTMTDAGELVLDIERDGRPSRLRYTITP
jgi:type II secretory pathway component PulC